MSGIYPSDKSTNCVGTFVREADFLANNFLERIAESGVEELGEVAKRCLVAGDFDFLGPTMRVAIAGRV